MKLGRLLKRLRDVWGMWVPVYEEQFWLTWKENEVLAYQVQSRIKSTHIKGTPNRWCAPEEGGYREPFGGNVQKDAANLLGLKKLASYRHRWRERPVAPQEEAKEESFIENSVMKYVYRQYVSTVRKRYMWDAFRLNADRDGVMRSSMNDLNDFSVISISLTHSN